MIYDSAIRIQCVIRTKQAKGLRLKISNARVNLQSFAQSILASKHRLDLKLRQQQLQIFFRRKERMIQDMRSRCMSARLRRFHVLKRCFFTWQTHGRLPWFKKLRMKRRQRLLKIFCKAWRKFSVDSRLDLLCRYRDQVLLQKNDKIVSCKSLNKPKMLQKAQCCQLSGENHLLHHNGTYICRRKSFKHEESTKISDSIEKNIPRKIIGSERLVYHGSHQDALKSSYSFRYLTQTKIPYYEAKLKTLNGL